MTPAAGTRFLVATTFFVGLTGAIWSAPPEGPEAAPAATVDPKPAVEKRRPTVDTTSPPAEKVPSRSGRLLRVPLPITAVESRRLTAALDRLSEQLPDVQPRPVLVVEFWERDAAAAADSEFEAALALATRLARLRRVQTSAYLPVSVRGHAVLAVLACEEIYIAADAEIGAAGIREERISRAHRGGYEDVYEAHKTLPWSIVLGMLDKSVRVHRVVTESGQEFALDADLEALRKQKLVRDVVELIQPGKLGVFRGTEARGYGFAKLLAASREEVARALELPPGLLVEDPSLGGKWRAVLVPLTGAVTPRSAQRVKQLISDQISQENVNFICLHIDSPGGAPEESIDLASFLVGLNSADVRTVAYIPREARADAALVALACDHVVMHPQAELGGFGAHTISPDELDALRVPVREKLAKGKARSWSLLVALVDPDLDVHRYVRRGDKSEVVDYFSADELKQLPDAARWQRHEIVTTPGRPLIVSGDRAEQLGLATDVVANQAALLERYHIDGPLVEIGPNWALHLIEALGDTRLAWLLLLVGFGAMYIELHTPGVGIGGFVSGLCFLLYFWSQFLNGTAGWLEALLFIVGVLCVALEIFVLPGMGIFGFGGGAMILASLVLASQTFVLPSLQNDYQMRRFLYSLLKVGGAIVGFVAMAIGLRKYLPRTPLFGHMVLEPPAGEERRKLQEREALVDLSFLLGQHGQTTTQCTPSGIARFGGELIHVISDGDVIPRGAEVVVVEAHGSRVVVRATT